jgi:hypothetical protein
MTKDESTAGGPDGWLQAIDLDRLREWAGDRTVTVLSSEERVLPPGEPLPSAMLIGLSNALAEVEALKAERDSLKADLETAKKVADQALEQHAIIRQARQQCQVELDALTAEVATLRERLGAVGR